MVMRCPYRGKVSSSNHGASIPCPIVQILDVSVLPFAKIKQNKIFFVLKNVQSKLSHFNNILQDSGIIC